MQLRLLSTPRAAPSLPSCSLLPPPLPLVPLTLLPPSPGRVPRPLRTLTRVPPLIRALPVLPPRFPPRARVVSLGTLPATTLLPTISLSPPLPRAPTLPGPLTLSLRLTPLRPTHFTLLLPPRLPPPLSFLLPSTSPLLRLPLPLLRRPRYPLQSMTRMPGFRALRFSMFCRSRSSFLI